MLPAHKSGIIRGDIDASTTCYDLGSHNQSTSGHFWIILIIRNVNKTAGKQRFYLSNLNKSYKISTQKTFKYLYVSELNDKMHFCLQQADSTILLHITQWKVFSVSGVWA